MKTDHQGTAKKEVTMELKYCEHCGGLWVRESGAGTVYCARCEAKVADLPAPKARAGRLILPVGSQTEIEKYEIDDEDETELDETELDAAGLNATDRDAMDMEAFGGAI